MTIYRVSRWDAFNGERDAKDDEFFTSVRKARRAIAAIDKRIVVTKGEREIVELLDIMDRVEVGTHPFKSTMYAIVRVHVR